MPEMLARREVRKRLGLPGPGRAFSAATLRAQAQLVVEALEVRL